jgi:hypothetical protein
LDFGIYTFPALVVGLSVALYAWQEPRMKALEKGRKNRLQKVIHELFNQNDLKVAHDKVYKFLDDGYSNHKDILMPIRKFRPYRKIAFCIVGAFFFATISALLQIQLQAIYIIKSASFSLSINDFAIYSMIFLCALPSRWLYIEFRYMQRIINLFDDHND